MSYRGDVEGWLWLWLRFNGPPRAYQGGDGPPFRFTNNNYLSLLMLRGYRGRSVEG